MMKKSILTILLISLVLILVACNKGQTDDANKGSNITPITNGQSSPLPVVEDGQKQANLGRQETLADLQAKGLWVDVDQSFPVELKNWGKVRFVSGIARDNFHTRAAAFFLVRDNGEIVYSFSDFPGNQSWTCFKVRAVAFSDVNHDGLRDVVIIVEYATGFGSTGAVPFPVASIYFQKGKEFVKDPNLDEQINNMGKNKTINMVLECMEGKNVQIN